MSSGTANALPTVIASREASKDNTRDTRDMATPTPGECTNGWPNGADVCSATIASHTGESG